MQVFSKLMIAGSLFALCACNNGGGLTTPGGALCPVPYDPIPPSAASWQKAINMDPVQNKSAPADSQMPVGRYTYYTGDIIYTAKTGVDPLQIHFHDLANVGTSVGQSVVCTHNAKVNMQAPATEFDAVTDVVVCPDFSQVVRTRTFKFDVTLGRIHFKGPDVKDSCLDSSNAAYPKGGALLLKDDATSYEVRTQTTLPDNSATYNVAVKMLWSQYIPAANDECAKKCFPTAPPTVSKPTNKSTKR